MRGEHLGSAIALHDFPCYSWIRIIDCSFAEQRRHARAQWRVHDIRMPHNPADVGSAPENITLAHIVEILQMVGRAHHVTAMHVHHALWLASRTRGVKQE